MPSAAQGKVLHDKVCSPVPQIVAVCVLILISAKQMAGSSALFHF